MNWGYHKLRDYDFLISCAGNEYYVARHVWGNRYRLDNGRKFNLSDETCNGVKERAKPIKLEFKKQSGGGQPTEKLQIMLSSCNFKKNGAGGKEQWNWNMACKVEKKENGTGGTGTESVTLPLSKDNYKLGYKRERKNTGR